MTFLLRRCFSWSWAMKRLISYIKRYHNLTHTAAANTLLENNLKKICRKIISMITVSSKICINSLEHGVFFVCVWLQLCVCEATSAQAPSEATSFTWSLERPRAQLPVHVRARVPVRGCEINYEWSSLDVSLRLQLPGGKPGPRHVLTGACVCVRCDVHSAGPRNQYMFMIKKYL